MTRLSYELGCYKSMETQSRSRIGWAEDSLARLRAETRELIAAFRAAGAYPFIGKAIKAELAYKWDLRQREILAIQIARTDLKYALERITYLESQLAAKGDENER